MRRGSGGSLVGFFLLPGAADTFGASASLVAWLTVTLLWICAGAFLARMPRRLPASASEIFTDTARQSP